MKNYNKYFEHVYDINGNIYEITHISFINNEVILSNVNDDSHITCKLDDFNFDSYIKNEVI